MASGIGAQVQSLEEFLSCGVLVRRLALERAAHGDDFLGGVGPFDALPAGLLPLGLERGDLCGFDAVTGVAAVSRRAQPCVAVRRRI